MFMVPLVRLDRVICCLSVESHFAAGFIDGLFESHGSHVWWIYWIQSLMLGSLSLNRTWVTFIMDISKINTWNWRFLPFLHLVLWRYRFVGTHISLWLRLEKPGEKGLSSPDYFFPSSFVWENYKYMSAIVCARSKTFEPLGLRNFTSGHAYIPTSLQNLKVWVPRSVGLVQCKDDWKLWFHLITGRNEVVAKVIFLHLSVILFTGGRGSASVHAGIPPPEQTPPLSRHPLGTRPPKEQTHPPGTRPTRNRHPPPRADPLPFPGADSSIRSTSGWYASYWNAFLFYLCVLVSHWNLLKSLVSSEGHGQGHSMLRSYQGWIGKI